MRTIAITFAVAFVIGTVAHFFREWSIGWVLLLIMVGLPLAGLLVTFDDDLPGGFSNPNADLPPPWRSREFWGEIVMRGSLSGVGFAIDAEFLSRDAVISICIAALGCIIGGMLMHQPQPAKSQT